MSDQPASDELLQSAEDFLPPEYPDAASILRQIQELRSECHALERQVQASLAAIHPDAMEGARNLIHYLALRRGDLRTVQPALAELGLSSLGRSESHVVANLNAVILCLKGLTEQAPSEVCGSAPTPVTMRRGRALLERAANRLLGMPPPGRAVRIMVTLPSDAADDPALVGRLLDAGMSVARINSAHDSPREWRRMCRNVREQSALRGLSCRILFDLAGPKIRTGPIEPGPEVLRIKPTRDVLGRVLHPAHIDLVPDQDGHANGIPVSPAFLASLKEGDAIELEDARGLARTLWVSARDSSDSCTVLCEQTVYFVPGIGLKGPRGNGARIGRLPPTEQALHLRPGDTLMLLRAQTPGFCACAGTDRTPPCFATIGCTFPEALANVDPGHAIWFDDGKIGGVVTAADGESIAIRITAASPKGDSLRADKGINLPDTALPIAGLTEQDRAALPLAAEEADLVGMSFVRSPADVRNLAKELASLGSRDVGLVLKIETRPAFENLPALLLAAMESPGAGVMIARGDLAVELGYGRLAEVQEEILWMCEAACVPVIWATQVLDTLAKKGRPSRAEVTDAAMAVRAECVMLNKGPYIVQAVEFLDGVLRRMQAHQSKKSPMLRALSIARRFGQSRE